MIELTLDFETRSECDLKKSGAIKYAMHPTTEVICMGWKINDEKTLIWNPLTEPMPKKFREVFWHPETVIVSHNAGFEKAICTYTLEMENGGKTPLDLKWRCTAAKAAAHALPRNLEGACLALNLPIQKDMEGRRLILKHCKPRKVTKNNPNKWHDDPEERKRIFEYCITDVDAERLLDKALPHLIPQEQKAWELNEKMNFRGVYIDKPLIEKILGMIEVETKNLKNEVNEITLGFLDNVTQRNEMLAFLESERFKLPNLQAKTVADALASGKVTGDAKRLLQIRQAISKTSTKKYQTFLNRVCDDGRLRDLYMFHGAGTGRLSATGLQTQNFPRGNIKDIEWAVELLADPETTIEDIRLLFGDVMSVFASALRGMITASPNKKLFAADYVGIELRVLFWVAKHEAGLRAIAEGRDLYKEMAADIYDLPVEKILKGSRERFVGKETILGAGYGMGWKKFVDTLEGKGIAIDDETAVDAIQSYREKHAPIPRLWKVLEMAAIKAVHEKCVVKVNYTKWFCQRGFLYCELPSGRRLAYRSPRIEWIKTQYGNKPQLRFWGVDSKTKKWVENAIWGGVLTENVVSGIARDLLVSSMLNHEAAGYDCLLNVHDEAVGENEKGSLDEFETIMKNIPEWGFGIPIAVEGFSGRRYKK